MWFIKQGNLFTLMNNETQEVERKEMHTCMHSIQPSYKHKKTGEQCFKQP